MGSDKPHAVCIPYAAQGHINPMLKLAKLLHSRGFYITFVYTEFNYMRHLRSRGSDSLSCLDDVCFETIPDGLLPSDRDATQGILALCDSTSKNCLTPFRNLVTKLNDTIGIPQVSCSQVSVAATSVTVLADTTTVRRKQAAPHKEGPSGQVSVAATSVAVLTDTRVPIAVAPAPTTTLPSSAVIVAPSLPPTVVPPIAECSLPKCRVVK